MTPIAELRTWFPFDSSTGGHHYDQVPDGESLGGTWHRLLDEIERLRGLLHVADAHRLEYWDDADSGSRPSCRCGWVAELRMPSWDDLEAAHAAHVAEILDGGAS